MAAGNSEDAVGKITLLTWNLDGLDRVGLISRTNAALNIIRQQDADVVLLQEVVGASLEIINQECLNLYKVFASDIRARYFTAVLVKRATVSVTSQDVIPFPRSTMGRKLQVLTCLVKGVNISVLNSHLESMTDHAPERMRQLNLCFSVIAKVDSMSNVIFGGDLNLGFRDHPEVPANMVDVWEILGSDENTRYTFDTKLNDNKAIDERSRVDRIYFRANEKQDIVPTTFALIGMERVPKCKKFPSDHWGIRCEFNIKAQLVSS